MVASRSRASIAACARTSCSRFRSACSLSAIAAANASPETESTAKNTSNRTAFRSGVFCAKGPEPDAVSIVAMTQSKELPGPLRSPRNVPLPQLRTAGLRTPKCVIGLELAADRQK